MNGPRTGLSTDPASNSWGAEQAAYMRGVAARASEHSQSPIDVSTPLAFLRSLGAAGWAKVEERAEASSERVDPDEVLTDEMIAFGGDVDLDDVFED